eukprot:CCRYP_014711-RA/>CCRYP_014711-RA protein AED:0.61 eAED:0.33 QI:0/-1/0/1/-1/1/1/0/407
MSLIKVSREDVLALMPHKTLTRIIGEPTYAAVRKLKHELGANLTAVKVSWGHGKGLLGELLPAAVFTARTGQVYTPPALEPPQYPHIPAGTAVADREHLRALNDNAKKEWQILEHARRIAVNVAAEAIKSVYYAEIEDADEGLNDVLIRDLLEHSEDRYCTITQDEIDKNMELFLRGIDPTLPLAVYTKKQEDCQEFSIDARVPISQELMVTTGTKHAVNCGDFHQAWREWRRTPPANQTWANWKTHWTRALQENCDIQRITGGGAGFAGNAMEDDIANQLVTILDNLAKAAVQKNETVEKLITMNHQKDQVIVSLTKSLEEETNSTLLDIIKAAGLKPNNTSNQTGGGAWEKKLDPNGYCWSHGYKVKIGHNSLTCRKRLEGHKENATRANTMGGKEHIKEWKPQA